ncbi:urease subunit gamma [Planomonospora sp. ID67723]|uniref:urease subunit gamma n=1 Tax=Planomonospora sp. ID67723 TaxID=2738134 RepID=UPI0018C3601A|nr:urease subunit gamma [Planomonospora sp. ID67723]MBG0831191.1 urease subunit gamma [Planomonospora sp. ID67723]
MRLTPTERDRLLLFTAAELARARRARGLRLNVPEATALIADAVCEAARDGVRLADAIEAGRAVLGPGDVLPGVADIVTEVMVEAVFDDGTRLAVVTDPIGGGSLGAEAPGAVLEPVPFTKEGAGARPGAGHTSTGRTGAVHTGTVHTTAVHMGATTRAGTAVHTDVPYGTGPVDGATGPGHVTEVEVLNTAAVPISVTSHFHFFEVNPRLRFDRGAAYGRRLAVPAGSTVRFDPGESRTVPLTPIGGARVAIGFAGLVDGALDAPGAFERAMEKARACGYLGSEA